MSETLEFGLNRASGAELAEHLARCDADFLPPLSTRVEIADYARKMIAQAARFEAWSGGRLVGLVAMYCNDQERRIAYITSVSVLHEWTSKGIATRLMGQCIDHAEKSGMWQVSLEVANDNKPAISLYEKNGFVVRQPNAPFVTMDLCLKVGK